MLIGEPRGRLLSILADLKKQRFDLRLLVAKEGLKDTSRVSELRRDIARVNTALSVLRLGDK